MAVIKRALISVSDKTGIVAFAEGLSRFGVEILSTGGTASMLREAGLVRGSRHKVDARWKNYERDEEAVTAAGEALARIL